VLNLLGGAVHEKLPVIASCHAHYEDIGAMVEEAQEWVAPGLHGVKVGLGKRGNARLGYEHDRDVEYMRRMREGLGPKAQIMLDCGWAIKWDVMTAVRRVQAFEEYDLTWIEEPLMEWDPEGYRNLRGKTTTLIAYGEKEWDLRGFEEVLATGTVDVVGIDPGRAEGITGFKKATERVEFYKRQSNAHAWSSAICSASSLAVSFSTPSAKLFEFKPLRNPMQHDLVTEPFEHIDGWVYPPTKPGLGIDIIEDVVRYYDSATVLADPKKFGAMA
jgi:L-alanine-DL-glutamate epimerase-like enolase superfamily enzyme